MTLRTLIDCFPDGVNTIPVQAIHGGDGYGGDCVQEEGWLFSKTAAADIGIARDRGVISVDDSAPIFTATVDRSLVGMLATASGEKTASGFADADEIAEFTQSLWKHADESDPGADTAAFDVEPKVDDGPDDATLASAWQGGDKTALGALLKRHDHIIKRHAARFHGADLPPSVIDAEAKQVAMKAFKNYDPNRGVRLSTYMTSYMPKIRSYVIKHQNPVRVSEDAALRIRSYRDAVDELTEKNGTQPSASEVADHRNWSLRDVKKTKSAMNGARISELDEETPELDDGKRKTDIFLDYVYHELEPHEQKVLEHMYGLYGTPKLESVDEIAKATGYSSAQTYRFREGIANKIKEHIDKV